ncbi:transposase [Cohnella cellulosilytica]|uniref:transposase n=5 Tax=Cohnella cellulosilytica TaxID=986710 RepID=UPI003616C364
MHNVRYKTFDQLSFADILVYSKLPDHPFWSHVEKKIDFSFADKLCSVLYTGRGQHPYAPSLKLKVHLIQAYYAMSDRQTEEKIIGDLFMKRFLELPVDFFGFDHSTIGLDRTRMGTAMFQACHLYVLAQMHHLGLWGEKNEQWIIDSFPIQVAMTRPGAYALIQRAMLRLFQVMKRSHHELFRLSERAVVHEAMLYRLPRTATKSDCMLAFSKLVAQAYGLLQWFQLEEVERLVQQWPNPDTQRSFAQLLAALKQILEENSRPALPDDAPPTSEDNKDAAVQYKKIPVKERPSNRIVNVTDVSARVGTKNKSTKIYGYKAQNLTTTNGVILDTKVIAATEHDREAMEGMVRNTQHFWGQSARELLGDSAYGHGKQREALDRLGVSIIAPVQETKNPTGLYDLREFTYNPSTDTFQCPSGQSTVKRHYSRANEGWQYRFPKALCNSCVLKSECTASGNGRSVFRSQYQSHYEQARVYNASTWGVAEHKLRARIESKNKELKQDCGLGEVRTRSMETLTIKTRLAAIVVNLKYTIRRLLAPREGFVRRARIN